MKRYTTKPQPGGCSRRPGDLAYAGTSPVPANTFDSRKTPKIDVCPFCGAEPEWNSDYDERSGWGDKNKGYLECRCGVSVGAPTPWHPHPKLTKTVVFNKWNQRSAYEEILELREKLRVALDCERTAEACSEAVTKERDSLLKKLAKNNL